MSELVQETVVGHVTFPLMKKCLSEIRTIPKEDGAHSFVFTDGTNSFSVRMNKRAKRHNRIS